MVQVSKGSGFRVWARRQQRKFEIFHLKPIEIIKKGRELVNIVIQKEFNVEIQYGK